jgi:hypothetical protein
VHWIFNILVCPELALHVFVAKQAHIAWEFPTMRAEQTAVEWNWREECKRL